MLLLDKIRTHLQRRPATLATDREGQPADLEVQAATVVLLLEAAYGDTDYEWREERAIVQGLEREFGLDKQEALRLVDRAHEILPPIVKLQDVIQVVQERYDEKQRQHVLALLWKVIDSDGESPAWEEGFAQHVTRAVGLSPEQGKEARAMARRGEV